MSLPIYRAQEPQKNNFFLYKTVFLGDNMMIIKVKLCLS